MKRVVDITAVVKRLIDNTLVVKRIVGAPKK